MTLHLPFTPVADTTGRRWFYCTRCRTVYVGGPIQHTPARIEAQAQGEHTQTCDGRPA